LIDREDLVYAWSATFGPYIWRGEKSIYHYHIWKLVPVSGLLDKYFFYNYLSRITEKMKNTGTGSIFTHITKAIMESQKILLPPKPLMSLVSEHFCILYGKMSSNYSEIETLASLRDTLLPRLISGQLRLPDAEALVEEAAA